MHQKIKTEKLTQIALIAAVYTALTIMFAPIGFGVVQFRISEALTMLAIFSPYSAVAVTLGCFVSNLIGMFMGVTVIWDVIFGTLATAIAALLSYMFRNVRIKNLPVLSALMPVIFNALIIGIMLSFVFSDNNSMSIMLMNIFSVGIGEFVVCFLFGIPLAMVLEKSGIDRYFK